jgi:hypothetical protein
VAEINGFPEDDGGNREVEVGGPKAGSGIGGKLVREGELTFKLDVIGRSTDRHLIDSWQSNPLLGRFVPVSKGTQVQRQSHCFGFTRLQVNLLEAFQFLDWPINGRILLADVELSYLSTGAFAGLVTVKLTSARSWFSLSTSGLPSERLTFVRELSSFCAEGLIFRFEKPNSV